MDRRRLLQGLGACGACALGGGVIGRLTAPAGIEPWYGTGPATKSERTRRRVQPQAVFRVRTDQALVGLTFDDGPDPRFTPTVLELLDRSGHRATFFLVGANAEVHHDLIADYASAGHGIGNHTSTHPELNLLAPDQVAVEITRGERQIVDAGLPRPDLFRPPKGYTDQTVGVLASADRYRTVFWTHCVEDYLAKTSSTTEAVDRLVADLQPGSIILAHDGGHVEAPGMPFLDRTRTMQALPPLLAGLERRGLQPVDLDTLMAAAR